MLSYLKLIRKLILFQIDRICFAKILGHETTSHITQKEI